MSTTSKLKLGLFGANCSSGRAVTMVPERWQATWRDNVHQRITVFGTVHAPLFPPIIAAKQMVTADHVGEGRFGLNLVCGWNEDEFEMFGVQPGDHERRYAQGKEWIDALSEIWSRNDFDFDGDFMQLQGVRLKPKPWNETRPLIMNAGASPVGKAFAIRNCDAFLTSANPLEAAAGLVAEAKAQARSFGRDLSVYTTCIVGIGGTPLTGAPDTIANGLAQISAAGFDGVALSFVNYLGELPFFRDEVLPRLERLGLRTPALQASPS